MANRLDPKKIALWRFEQLEEALDPDLTKRERARILKQKSKVPVCWPSGVTKKIPVSTLYRWHKLYRQGGIEALRPKERKDRGKKRSSLSRVVVDEALNCLISDPTLTLMLLIAFLKIRFGLSHISRSTLQRRLSEREAYVRLRRIQKHRKRRRRFVARRPHQIWQCDAKGPVTIKLKNGQEISFHVLSILDDASRALMAAIVVPSPDLGACVRVFRIAALRYGLPSKYYADRARIFDAQAFRAGLATLGTHRIRTAPRAKEAHGKIEAYHRSLAMWFTTPLEKQVVIDFIHLQQLFEGFIGVYQNHYHRSVRMTPKKALGNQVSAKQVPPSRLYEVFRQEKRLKAHAKTGEIEIQGVTYLVPDALRGQVLTFLLDPPGEVEPLVVHPTSKQQLPVKRATIKPEDLPEEENEDDLVRHAPGILQTLADHWRGMTRPQAEPGFGLPDIYAWLSRVAGRHVPSSDDEAAQIQRFYHQHGPWAKANTESAMENIRQKLGEARPIKTYLDCLEELVVKKPIQANQEEP